MTDTARLPPRGQALSARSKRPINNLSLGSYFRRENAKSFSERALQGNVRPVPEQVKPATDQCLIRHRAGSRPQGAVAPMITSVHASAATSHSTQVQEFADGRSSLHRLPGARGGGMATHETLPSARAECPLKKQYELGKEQEETLRVRNFSSTPRSHMSQGLCFRFRPR